MGQGIISCTHCLLMISCILSLLIFSFLIIPLPCSSNQPPSSTQHLLQLGSTLSIHQTQLSSNGRFAVGLFSLPRSAGSVYFGIWYAQVPDQTVVWIANREQPASSNASWSLSIQGELQLLDAGRPVWSSGTSGLGVQSASLQDTGNLILQSANFTSVIWESFQNPSTNVWLPHMRLKRGQKLQSWRSSADPAVGVYALEMHAWDYGLVWNNSRQYWSTGVWTGHGFEGLPAFVNGSPYYFDFSATTGFQYYPNPNYSDFDISHALIGVDGRIQIRSWDQVIRQWSNSYSVPSYQCAVYDLCGPNSACNDNQSPPCTCLLGFQPVHPQDWLAETWSGGCEIEVSNSERNWIPVILILGTLFGAFLLLLAAVAAFSFIRNRSLRSRIRNVLITGGSIVFSYMELQLITNKFKQKIGSGGCGTVFKGTLPDDMQVAVKTLERHDHAGEKQFLAEVRTIGKIQHINLVRLIGFCCEGTHRLLVYEYMPRGSLDALLFAKNSDGGMKRGVLDWSIRFNIALGIARAITYLHEECQKCIIHLDIKPANILLDESFCPKLSDFGLAKLMGREFSRVVTTMRGTRGYLAPEWLEGSPITAKADVYSYGMTLLEIISGRRNIDTTVEDLDKLFFPVWAALQVRKHAVMKLVDERLAGEEGVEEEQVRRMAHAALWCIQDSEQMRPCMSKVVQMLEGNLHLDPCFSTIPPIPQSLLMLVEDKYFDTSV